MTIRLLFIDRIQGLFRDLINDKSVDPLNSPLRCDVEILLAATQRKRPPVRFPNRDVENTWSNLG